MEKQLEKHSLELFASGGGITNEFEKPKMEANSKFITYLRPNNGMTEAETGSNLSASDAIMKKVMKKQLK